MTPEEELLYLADLCLQASYWRLSEGETKCPIELEIESRIKKCELHHRVAEAASISEAASIIAKEEPKKPKPAKVRALCDGVRRNYFPEETAMIPSKRRGYPKRVALDSPEYREYQANKIRQASEDKLNGN